MKDCWRTALLHRNEGGPKALQALCSLLPWLQVNAQGYTDPPLSTPALPLPAHPSWGSSQQGNIYWMRTPWRERFFYWLYVWRPRTSSIFSMVIHPGIMRDRLLERCRCLSKLWSGLYNIVLIYAWKPPHSLPLCHLSPKPTREEDYIVPGNYMSMKSFFLNH